MTRRLGRVALAAGLAAGVLLASACNDDPNSIAGQANSGSRAGYVAGNGAIEELAPDKRAAPLDLSGTTLDGGQWSLATQGKGKVVVVNVWGAWCPPCVAELPILQTVYAAYQTAGKPVTFVGVDTQEPPANAVPLLDKSKVTYPSISDQASDGAPSLQLAGKAPATPTTLVLDIHGRIAGRVLGAVSEATLRGLLDDVLAQG
jgi:thiol-disulfide isomerase/thioredoxin